MGSTLHPRRPGSLPGARRGARVPAASPMDAQGKGTIKIATQSPLSGGQAALGEGIKLGTQLAVEKFKGNLEKAGFKVELVPFDDQAKPDVGVANAKNIIADKDILGVIGHLNSGVAIPSSEVYKEVNLAMISPANTNPTVTDRGYANVNRVCGRDDVQGVVGSEFAHGIAQGQDRLHHPRQDDVRAGRGRVLQGRRGEEGDQGPRLRGDRGEVELRPDHHSYQGQEPRPHLLRRHLRAGGAVLQAPREKGIKAKFMGPDGMDSSDLTKIAGKAVVGMHYTSVAGPVSVYPQAKQFANEYKKKFGKNPEPFAAQAYDATAIVLKAHRGGRQGRQGARRRDSVTAAVRNVKHTGITGSVEFDDKGDPKKALYFVLQVASDNPEKWGDNKEVKRLTIAAPAAAKK